MFLSYEVMTPDFRKITLFTWTETHFRIFCSASHCKARALSKQQKKIKPETFPITAEVEIHLTRIYKNQPPCRRRCFLPTFANSRQTSQYNTGFSPGRLQIQSLIPPMICRACEPDARKIWLWVSNLLLLVWRGSSEMRCFFVIWPE